MLFFNTKIIAHFNKDLLDFPKLPMQLIDRLINVVFRYFEERSRVSCRYILCFLSALMVILVSNPVVSSKI